MEIYQRRYFDGSDWLSKYTNNDKDEGNGTVPVELLQTVILRSPSGKEEERTALWCLENGYVEIQEGIYGTPPLPESMKRFLNGGTGSDVDYDSGEEQGVTVRSLTDEVSTAEAFDSLQYCQRVLVNSFSQDEPWQNPKELLDLTSCALDDAALSLRGIENDPMFANEVKEIRQLSGEIIKSRKILMEASLKCKVSLVPHDMKKDKTLLVWATHTGTAERFIKILQNDHGDCDAINMKDLNLVEIASRKRVFFCCSTFGLGRPPRDSEMFFTILQLLETQSKPLSGVEFSIAALGNSKFDDYATFGDYLSGELRLLGAKELIPVYKIDARYGPEKQNQQYNSWREGVLKLENKPITLLKIKKQKKGNAMQKIFQKLRRVNKSN
eukprot:CAMPEP_0178954184 /NCGR_PEP_ID=MMETSP0789-20121207/8846_1 /TAXON_ID=3005 /ORGANISM="Rhizosolenia setigera, Strain CCMP 1694" /LENGTH=382 /DNA_ID=CAMNT_0020635551 /DNA_START=173 /DNA_END=1321 /DNA_ORIENTATION=-